MTAPKPLAPGSTIGILGGGQLGRMLAMAAARLGLQTHIYSDGRDACAFDVAHAHTVGDFDDTGAVEAFARHVDVVTYEFENLPLEAVLAAERAKPVRPGPQALRVAQDRFVEKTFMRDLGLATAAFAAVDTADEADRQGVLFHLTAHAADAHPGRLAGKPYAILKTRRLGYDGKGQVALYERDAGARAFAEVGAVPAVIEQFVSFDAELSVLVVRGLDGAMATYDVPRNTHEKGILATSRVGAAAGLPAEVETDARAMACRIADRLDYVGVLAVEMFYAQGKQPTPHHLVINEIAPRVHNSGHWTLDACMVSQFENHIRAIAGWPLGSTARHSDAVMANIIGPDADSWPRLSAQDGLCVHLYGKGLARPGRKMGHTTRLSTLTRP